VNLDKIIQVKLHKEDLKLLPKKEDYNVVFLDKKNYIHYTDEINTIIRYIKQDLPNWKESPDFNDIVKRFQANSHCILFYYKNKCIGWNWGNENVCFDWVNCSQTLSPGEIYCGGCFVTKSVERPADSGLYNYNMFCDYYLNHLSYNKLYGYIDSWNKPAIRVNLQTGVKFFNFIVLETKN
jgi:hypothetical protein